MSEKFKKTYFSLKNFESIYENKLIDRKKLKQYKR